MRHHPVHSAISRDALLLAAIAELLVDDDVLRDRCHQEVATRAEHLPKWLADPSLIEAYRVARYRHDLGDGEEWAIGVRVSGGSEFTISAYIDHNTLSAITNVAVHMTPIDEVDRPIHAYASTTTP